MDIENRPSRFDAIVDPIHSLSFVTQCETTLNVGMVTTSLALSARAGHLPSCDAFLSRARNLGTLYSKTTGFQIHNVRQAYQMS